MSIQVVQVKRISLLILSFVLMATVVSTILVPRTGRAITDDQLYNVWDLEETSGVRYDSVGTNDLTDNNTVTYSGTGINGNGAYFTRATSEYLSTTGLTLTYPLTVSFWVRNNSQPAVSNFYGLYTFCDYTTSKNLLIQYWNHSGTYKISDGSNDSAYTLTTNSWFHIVQTVSSAYEATTYINGVKFGSSFTIGSATVTGHKYVVGDIINCNGGTTYSRYYDGTIDEFYIFDSVLSTSTISEIYNAGVGTFYPYGVVSTSSTSTATTTSSVDVEELKWVLELYLAIFMFLLFTWLGYRFTKFFI